MGRHLSAVDAEIVCKDMKNIIDFIILWLLYYIYCAMAMKWNSKVDYCKGFYLTFTLPILESCPLSLSLFKWYWYSSITLPASIFLSPLSLSAIFRTRREGEIIHKLYWGMNRQNFSVWCIIHPPFMHNNYYYNIIIILIDLKPNPFLIASWGWVCHYYYYYHR